MTKLKNILWRVFRGGLHFLSEMLAGRGPIIRHTWRHTLSLYPNAKSKIPCARIGARDDKRISVLRLVLYFLCAVCALTLAALLIKRIRDKIRQRRLEPEPDECEYAEE